MGLSCQVMLPCVLRCAQPQDGQERGGAAGSTEATMRGTTVGQPTVQVERRSVIGRCEFAGTSAARAERLYPVAGLLEE